VISDASTIYSTLAEEKSPDAFKTISEVADQLGVPQHVLRFWESRFPQIKPLYRAGRRYYRPEDIDILNKIQHLLKQEGYTIKGAKKAFSDTPLAPPPTSPHLLTDKQHSQLSVMRQELISMRDVLKDYVE
jgi:DNA-binding transcriptional MerR regulator